MTIQSNSHYAGVIVLIDEMEQELITVSSKTFIDIGPTSLAFDI